MKKNRKSYRNLDLTGKRYGYLKVLRKNPDGRSSWICQCECGNQIIVFPSKLFEGHKSCGCMHHVRPEGYAPRKTHGDSYTKLYSKYRGMLDRCYNKKNFNYPRYGGRGITVCDEWKGSYEAFRDWAYSTGYDPSLNDALEQSIDRKDNNGNYCPENCKWSTAKEQQNNRECVTLYSFNNIEYNVSEFCDKFGIDNKSFVYRRLQHGQTLEYILSDWEKIHDVPDHLIEVDEYAQKHNMHQGSVKRLLRNGKLSGEKIGRKWYVSRIML